MVRTIRYCSNRHFTHTSYEKTKMLLKPNPIYCVFFQNLRPGFSGSRSNTKHIELYKLEMTLTQDRLTSIEHEVQSITTNTVRLRNIGSDNSIVYEELVDLIQSQFRKTEANLQTLQFDIEDLLNGPEKTKAEQTLKKVSDSLKL